jgi:hypothetical protein
MSPAASWIRRGRHCADAERREKDKAEKMV